MYRRLKGLTGDVPLRLVAMVLFAVLLPSLLVTVLGLFTVSEADRSVREWTARRFRDRLDRLAGLLSAEWERIFSGYTNRIVAAAAAGRSLTALQGDARVSASFAVVGDEVLRLPRPQPRILDLAVEPVPARVSSGPGGWKESEASPAARIRALALAAGEAARKGMYEESLDAFLQAADLARGFVDEAGVPVELPLLLAALEAAQRIGPEAASGVRRRLLEVHAAVSSETPESVRRYLNELLDDKEGGRPARVRTESEVLPPKLASALRQAATRVRVEGRLVFVPPLPQSDGGEFAACLPAGDRAVCLVFNLAPFLEDVELLAPEADIDPADLVVMRNGVALYGDSRRLREREVVARRSLPPPLDGFELAHLAALEELPSSFRSFTTLTLISQGWAVVILVVAVVFGVYFTLRSVLREMRTARLKSDFVGFISHELKTPIASIRMFTEMLLDERLPAKDRAVCLRMIDQESGRLARLIDTVLEYARLEKHQKAFRFRSCDMAEVVREAVAVFRAHHPQDRREIEINSAQKISKIKMDRESMVELLLNLLSNASKYSPPDRKIVINLRESIDEICVDVIDQGIGIPKRDQKRIFEKFFRAQDYLTREVDGMGLGLAFARYIARVHNGTIKVTSHVNSGSTFTLQLKKTHVLAE